MRHSDTCNCGMSAWILPTFNQASAVAQVDRRNLPTLPRSWKVNPMLNLPRSGLGPETQGEKWRMRLREASSGAREAEREAAAARTAPPRRDAHLSLLPGPEEGPRSLTGVARRAHRSAEGRKILPRSTRVSL